MTETVQCAECGTAYDSEDNPFCPRCGGIEHAEGSDAAVQIAARSDPHRRRVQAAGIILVTVGIVTMALFATAAALTPSLVPQTMEALSDQPGGDLSVHVLDGGGPAEGVAVQVLTMEGRSLANGTTDGQGWANFTGLAHAGVNVTVHGEGGDWVRSVLTLQGANEGPNAAVLELDTADDPRSSSTWVGVDAFVQAVRVVAIVFAAVAALTLASGIASLRLRQRNLAFTGTLVGGLPWLVLGVASFNLLVFLVLGLFILSAVFLRQGRAQFQD